MDEQIPCNGCEEDHAEPTTKEIENLHAKLKRRYKLFAIGFLCSTLFTVISFGLFNVYLGYASFFFAAAIFFHVNLSAVSSGKQSVEHIMQVIDYSSVVDKLKGKRKDPGQYL